MSPLSRNARRLFGAAGLLLLFALVSPLPPAPTVAAQAGGVFLPLIGSAPVVCNGAIPGLVSYTHTKYGNPVRLDVQGDRVYIVDWSGSLMIFDISVPCQPERLGYALWQENEFQDVAVVGDAAYVANDANGLAKYDVSNPAAPRRVAARKDGPGYANSIVVKDGRYAFVSQHYAPYSVLAIYDLTAFPAAGPTLYWPGPDWEYGWDVEVAGNRAYISVSTRDAGTLFQILDITGVPAVPTVVATLELPRADYGDGFGIKVSGDMAYLTSRTTDEHDGGLVIVDMTDETAPFVAGSYFFHTAATMPWKRPGLEVVGERVYVVGVDGLYAFDVADPRHITLLFNFRFPYTFGRAVGGDVVIRGDLAFVAVRNSDAPSYGDVGGLAIYHLPAVRAAGRTPPPAGQP